MDKWLVAGLAASVAAALAAAPVRNVVGSGMGGNSPYATDAYPGFDGLDDVPRPERREKSWFLSVKRDTPAGQYSLAEELEALGEYKDAARAFDALVREWPASPEAPRAQLRFATLLAGKLDEYEDAFDQLEYLLDFYPKDCPYLEIVEKEYQLVNLMVKTRKSFLGFSFLSNRLVRQHYESIVRRAPGAAYVPEAMLRIADLREQDSHYEEAIEVYASLSSKFPQSDEARLAAYLEARARMWLCRRLAYNIPRCKDTVGYLKATRKRLPDLEQIDELKAWEEELSAYLAEDAFRRARFYDARQRTRHAAIAAWEQYLRDYPESAHEQAVRDRIAQLQNGAAPGTFKEGKVE
ncbi:MAG: tol-pal system YbgF family protein [Kiritimatiellia bacterium]